MASESPIRKVNEIQLSQAFHEFDARSCKEIRMENMLLSPNQFAYTVDCRNLDIVKVKGNLTGLTGIEKLNSLAQLQNSISPKYVNKYVEETFSALKFAFGNGERTVPFRNVFCGTTVLKSIYNKNRPFYKQKFSVRSDQNGIVTHTGAIYTHLDGLKVSTLPFNQFTCEGKDGIYYQMEELASLSSLFTIRELELLKLIACGYRTNAIASQMHISKNTVETHRKNMLKKLEAKNTPHMVALTKEMGLI